MFLLSLARFQQGKGEPNCSAHETPPSPAPKLALEKSGKGKREKRGDQSSSVPFGLKEKAEMWPSRHKGLSRGALKCPQKQVEEKKKPDQLLSKRVKRDNDGCYSFPPPPTFL
jgi:hypothetical protein